MASTAVSRLVRLCISAVCLMCSLFRLTCDLPWYVLRLLHTRATHCNLTYTLGEGQGNFGCGCGIGLAVVLAAVVGLV